MLTVVNCICEVDVCQQPSEHAMRDYCCGMKVQVEDLIDSMDVAQILGLSSPRAVHVYQSRYPRMPRPVIDRGPNRARLWLKSEIVSWAKERQLKRQS
jgi:hypothetical protein